MKQKRCHKRKCARYNLCTILKTLATLHIKRNVIGIFSICTKCPVIDTISMSAYIMKSLVRSERWMSRGLNISNIIVSFTWHLPGRCQVHLQVHLNFYWPATNHNTFAVPNRCVNETHDYDTAMWHGKEICLWGWDDADGSAWQIIKQTTCHF